MSTYLESRVNYSIIAKTFQNIVQLAKQIFLIFVYHTVIIEILIFNRAYIWYLFWKIDLRDNKI